MKTSLTIHKPTVKEAEYPRVKRLKAGSLGHELIVVFSSPTAGTVLHSDYFSRNSGAHETDFAPDLFEDYNGQVTLGNN